MSELLQEATEQFLDAMAPAGDDVIREMESYGETHGPTTVGRPAGQLLRVVTALSGANRVFEFGSGYGYSGYWFALGGAEVVLTDVDEPTLERARTFFEQGGLADRATFELGDAHAAFERHDGPFDVVFVDHDKERYAEAFAAAREKLAPGGLVIVDNAMISTSIQFERLVAALEGDEPDLNDSTRGVADFLLAARDDDAFETSVLPVGEGVALCRFAG